MSIPHSIPFLPYIPGPLPAKIALGTAAAILLVQKVHMDTFAGSGPIPKQAIPGKE